MKLRHKLLLFGLAAAALTALAVFVSAGILIRHSVADRVEEKLRDEANLLAEIVARDPALLPERREGAHAEGAGRPQEFARSAGNALGFRVTLIGPDGTVAGDSDIADKDIAGMENHAHRPEVLEARSAGIGFSRRYSSSVRQELLYIARRVDREGRLAGFVRLSVPQEQIDRTTGNYSLHLAMLCFFILLGVAAIGGVAAWRFTRPIEEMSRRADAIAAGRRDLEVEYASRDEIGTLGAAVNRMTRAITEQVDALTGEKALLDTILRSLGEGILVVDGERRVLLCNGALKELLELRADPAGSPLIEITRDHQVNRGFDAALEQGVWSREIIPASSGTGRSLQVSVAPLEDALGARMGAVGVFSDVTRLATLEGVRREFVADVSHELRTPLTSIKAFIETLLAGGLEDAANNRRFLEIIRKHSDRMEAILDDLTDLSLIETGAVTLQKERVGLRAVVTDMLESVRPGADARQVSLVAEVPEGLQVVADRRRLEQVLLNLLDNAIKFNRPGGVVTVRAFAPDDAGALRVVVEDTGVGIPAGAIEKVFNRFYRVDRARSRELGGTGLGLAIVKHLMRLHGGAVRVESEAGRGTRFILEFPGDTGSSGGESRA